MLFLNAVRYGSSNSVRMLSSVYPPSFDWKAPIRTLPAGRIRKASA
jgi:hypothetical protein